MQWDPQRMATDLIRVSKEWQHTVHDPYGCVDTAWQLVTAEEGRDTSDSETSRFCLVTKRPHAEDSATLAVVVSRLLGFGATVHAVRGVRHPETVAEALYATAASYFKAVPATQGLQERLTRTFDVPDFKTIFGVPYSSEFVVAGADVLSEFNMTSAELTSLWEEGRTPISATTLSQRYGSVAAAALADGAREYAWFRGAWPIGIHRIASGLMAFAMRHERFGDDPLIIINGHYPGLEDLFGPQTKIVEAGLATGGPGIDAVRRWVVGHDNRPDACFPGTIRHDASIGILPIDALLPVDSRQNVVHCSDGLLAGMIEVQRLFEHEHCRGSLATQLLRQGLTVDELQGIVAADPLVIFDGDEHPLTEITRGQPLEDVVSTVLHFVPPVFGPANGFASGPTVATLAREYARLAQHESDIHAYSHRERAVRNLVHPATPVEDLDPQLATAGTAMIAEGKVALLIPAGGTGGRFGSYALPETAAERQKALAPVFRVDDQPCCALDIRLANARWWRRHTGGRLPMAVMASATNHDAVLTWAASNPSDQITIYQQYGTYRLRADRAGRGTRWVDAILRTADGTPSLKPPGNLGLFTGLAMAGMLDRWTAEGVEVVAVANADDVGFRLQSGIVGLLCDTEVEAAVLGVPWGIGGSLDDASGNRKIRGDVSGHCVDALGEVVRLSPVDDDNWEIVNERDRRIVHAARDQGGAICETYRDDGWRVGIAEVADRRAFTSSPLFSTNQMYVRLPVLHDLLRDGIQSLTDQQPFYAEKKVVMLDSGPVPALQLAQGANDLVSRMKVVALSMSRKGRDCGYAVLKTQSDVPFAQQVLDRLAKGNNCLSWA